MQLQRRLTSRPTESRVMSKGSAERLEERSLKPPFWLLSPLWLHGSKSQSHDWKTTNRMFKYRFLKFKNFLYKPACIKMKGKAGKVVVLNFCSGPIMQSAVFWSEGRTCWLQEGVTPSWESTRYSNTLYHPTWDWYWYYRSAPRWIQRVTRLFKEWKDQQRNKRKENLRRKYCITQQRTVLCNTNDLNSLMERNPVSWVLLVSGGLHEWWKDRGCRYPVLHQCWQHCGWICSGW